MKKLFILLLILTSCEQDLPRDKDGNITGRIENKFVIMEFERERPMLMLGNGVYGCMGRVQHGCYVSKEEYEKRQVGEVYTCKYK